MKNYGFNDIGYLVDEFNEVTFIMDWSWLYGELSKGSYRIIKQVNNQYIAIPFNIATTS
ncbi:MAG: immunoglobulin-like domain-containing protein [Acutalibacteraceae bacterium]